MRNGLPCSESVKSHPAHATRYNILDLLTAWPYRFFTSSPRPGYRARAFFPPSTGPDAVVVYTFVGEAAERGKTGIEKPYQKQCRYIASSDFMGALFSLLETKYIGRIFCLIMFARQFWENGELSKYLSPRFKNIDVLVVFFTVLFVLDFYEKTIDMFGTSSFLNDWS